MSEFSSEDEDIIILVTIFSACFGLMGSLFIIVMFLGYKELRKFSYRLIVYLAISDSGMAISILIGHTGEGACVFQGVMMTYFGLSTIFWATVIAWVLYKSVVGLYKNIETLEKWLIVVGFLTPIGVALLPLSTESYNES